MKSPYQWLAFIFCLIVFQSHAMPIKAVYLDGKLHWQNAYYISNDRLVPSVWTPVNGLMPTRTWIPGGLKETYAGLTLRPTNNENPELAFANNELNLIGIEYHIGSTSQRLGDSSPSSPSCTLTEVALPLVSVIGNGINCFLANKLIIADGRQEPFAFIRPIYQINEQAILNRLSGSGSHPIPADTYSSGNQSFGFFYNYYYDPEESPMAGLTRRYLSAAFSVDIEVASLANVEVSVINGESQQMDVMYFPDGRIEGKAYFEFEISGALPNGYKMTLTNLLRREGSDFVLSKTDDNSQTIPYSIYWRSPNDSVNNNRLLVDEGQLVHNNIIDEACVLNGRVSSCRERYLDVSFKLTGAQAENIATGSYQTQFIAMFEPML